MTTITDNPRIEGRARVAGSRTIHTVTVDGRVVGTRGSHTRRYRFAIAHWARPVGARGGERTVYVDRWSDSPKCSGDSFAIRIADAE